MIELLAAFALGLFPSCVIAWMWATQSARDAEERATLLDRVQSPDLATYYGARAAYHPEDFPAPAPVDLLRDEFGYLEEPRDGHDRLPGELPASEL